MKLATPRINNRAARRRCQAFTLAEVLAAMLFLAIVIPVAVEALHVSSLAGEVAARKGAAARMADRVLNESLVTTNWSSGGQSGTVSEGALDFHWTLTSQNWPQDPTMQLLTAEVKFPAQGKDYSVKLSTLASLQTQPGSRAAGDGNEFAIVKIKMNNMHAFTLIEMVLAIGVAAIVLIAVNTVLFAALRLRDTTADVVDAATPLDQAVTFIRRDLQCVVTPTNGTTKVLSGDFRAGNVSSAGVPEPVAVEMFTATGALSANAPWADIQRVTYELKQPTDRNAVGKDLYRSVVRNLLTMTTPDVEDQLMLSGVQSIKFSCFDGSQWQDTWDTTGVTSTYTNLPLAVRVDIQMAGNNTANAQPIELVVPIDAQTRTNTVLTATQ